MAGLAWKRNAEEALDRRRRFFRGEMLDGVLATLPVAYDVSDEWEAFDRKWPQYEQGRARPFPSNEEIFERDMVGMQKRGQCEDDSLPACYSILDAGESMVSGMFGKEMNFLHRPRGPAISKPCVVLEDYSHIGELSFSIDNKWARRFLEIQDYFAEHMGDRFAQHPCLTMDALNFVCEIRGATQAYLDLYVHPEELRDLMEIGLDFNVRFQEAQMERTGSYADGSFVWLGGWVPFPAAVSLSVDAYVICSPEHYIEFGLEYQSRLIERFGAGLMHFHCNRVDLAAEVAKLPSLRLFQFGGDPNDPKPSVAYVPEMKQVLGDVPLMVSCSMDYFMEHTEDGTLPTNVWYGVGGGPLSVDEANRLMEKVRAYRA